MESLWRVASDQCVRQHCSSLEHARKDLRSLQVVKQFVYLLLEQERYPGRFGWHGNQRAHMEPQLDQKGPHVSVSVAGEHHGYSVVK